MEKEIKKTTFKEALVLKLKNLRRNLDVRNVSWPSRKETWKKTAIVIVVCAVAAVLTISSDILLSFVIKLAMQ